MFFPQAHPAVASRRTRLRFNVRVKNRIGILPIGSHQHRFSVRVDHQRTTDALAAFPRTVGQAADVADGNDSEAEIARRRAIVVPPELTVWFLSVVVIGWHRPGAR